ncbi:hypothetical protein K435DRAFT_778565 [Dendrothele bispora CBS 962.96]|uniref:Lipoyl-binding domain-containing protein n=1 Tax=Dendrothele bispora (strain CBS 962.96) TaxID=1314807 RepID=A0A4V4HFV2_DENBC|nr:hypothetical protein K435DRAFT_778565 [Dendrothele bispora CBS 962.96]
MTANALLSRTNSLTRTVRNGPVTRVRKHSFHESRPPKAIMMPSMSPLMTEGTITRWNKKEGEAFAAGDVLFLIESDYGFAPLEIRAEIPGVLGRILMPEGSTRVPVEQIIALVADKNSVTTIRPQIRVDIPPTPVPGALKTASSSSLTTPTSAPVFNTVSLKPRLPPRPHPHHHHHYHHSISHVEHNHPSLLHSSIHRSPSPSLFESHSPSDGGIHSAGVSSVRGMVIDHHNLICPSPTKTSCASVSSIGCASGVSEPLLSEAETRVTTEAAADLRRKIMSNLARTGSMKGGGSASGRCATTEYFDGIL